jgi:hypothetical protein
MTAATAIGDSRQGLSHSPDVDWPAGALHLYRQRGPSMLNAKADLEDRRT